jgi:hypothetical protein
MLDCVESLDKKTLCDKAKNLAVKELVLFMAEEAEEAERQRRNSRQDNAESPPQKNAGTGPGHSTDYTTDFFELQAAYQVGAYNLKVTKRPTLFASM